MKTPPQQLKELVEHMAIYKIVKSREASEEKEIPISAIGKREDMTVYREVVRRLEAGQ